MLVLVLVLGGGVSSCLRCCTLLLLVLRLFGRRSARSAVESSISMVLLLPCSICWSRRCVLLPAGGANHALLVLLVLLRLGMARQPAYRFRASMRGICGGTGTDCTNT